MHVSRPAAPQRTDRDGEGSVPSSNRGTCTLSCKDATCGEDVERCDDGDLVITAVRLDETARPIGSTASRHHRALTALRGFALLAR